MPALTGQNITIEIDSVAYTGVVASATLISNNNVSQYVTLSSSEPIPAPTTWQLNVRGLQNWDTGVSPGFSRALWNAAVAASTVTFELVVDSGTFTGSIQPVFPNAGGDATAVLEDDMTFEVVGIPTLT